MMLSVQDVAKRLNVSPACVYRLVSGRKVACHRIGDGRGAVRIREEDLNAYLSDCRVEKGEEVRPRPRGHRLKHLRL